MVTLSEKVGSSANWSANLLALARVIFGFLVSRHGTEQVFNYPEPSGALLASYEGVLGLVSLPGGLLLMLGLFTRSVGLVLGIMYGLFWFIGPLHSGLTQGHYVFGARGGGDEAALNWFFFLYLSTTAAGVWSLDRYRKHDRMAAEPSPWTPYALGVLRIAAGFFFFHHGLEKWFGISGGRADINFTTLRGVAGFLELTGGSLLMLGLFSRQAAFILSGQMAVAYFTSWAPMGFWRSFSQPNYIAAIQNCFLFLFLSAAGPGMWSLARVLARRRLLTGQPLT